MYSSHTCIECKQAVSHKPGKDGMCPICRERVKKRKPQIACALEGCPETFLLGGNRKYCVDHRGLNKKEKAEATAKLLLLSENKKLSERCNKQEE
jgi:hypothetical protein